MANGTKLVGQALIDDFYKKTRLKFVNLDTMTRPTGGGQSSQTIRRVGLLQGIYLPISVTVAGTLSNPNALGIASAVQRISVSVNSSGLVFDCSMSGYLNLVNEQLGTEFFAGAGTTLNQGNTAVTATTFLLYVYIPIAMNRRDPLGLVLLQSEQQTVELQIQWAADATVATGATVTGTVRPKIACFDIPSDGTLPPLNYLHQIIEDSNPVSQAGDVPYSPIRGNVYLSVWHGLTLAASAADSFSRVQVWVDGSNLWMDNNIADMDQLYYLNRGRTRRAGVIAIDFMASSELGTLGLTRDWFNTAQSTDYRHIITATGSGTLTTVRRMLNKIPSAA